MQHRRRASAKPASQNVLVDTESMLAGSGGGDPGQQEPQQREQPRQVEMERL